MEAERHSDRLGRTELTDGRYLASFQDLPGQPVWPRERIFESLDATLAQRPSPDPVWLFGYGSLVWNPLLDYAERAPAMLAGWQRRFCLTLRAGRASPTHPGRMAALVAGGHCAGAAYRIAEDKLRPELELVWLREMVYGDYVPTWTTVRLCSGASAQALTFVADRRLPQCASDWSVDAIAPLIATASGPMGSNRAYLLELRDALAQRQIHDAYIEKLATAVEARAVAPQAET